MDPKVSKQIVEALKKQLLGIFPIDKNMVDKLEAEDLLDTGNASEMRSLVEDGKAEDAVTKFLTYMDKFYEVETLSELCNHLETNYQAKPKLKKIASMIREEIEKFTDSDEDKRSASKRRKVEPSTSGSETSDNSGTKYQNEDSYDKDECQESSEKPSITWKMSPPLPESVKFPSAAASKDYLYVMAKGNTKKKSWTNKEGDKIYQLRFGSCKWEEMPEFTRALKSFALACDQDHLYVTGGNKPEVISFEDDSGAVSEVITWNYEMDEWDSSKVPPMNNPRFCHGAATFSRYLVVAGGINADNTIEIIDTTQKQQRWFEVTTLPMSMVWPYIVVSGKKVYFGLGCTENYKEPNNYIHALSRKDLETAEEGKITIDFEKWEEFKIPPPPLQSSALAINKDTLIAVGGTTKQEPGKYPLTSQSSCYCLSPKDNKWRRFSEMKHKRSSPCIVYYGNMIYVLGGWIRVEEGSGSERQITYSSKVEKGEL